MHQTNPTKDLRQSPIQSAQIVIACGQDKIIVSEYDQEIPQSQTTDNPMAP